MTNIKDLSDWIYENVARELGRMQNRDMSSTPITEEVIRDNFRTWFNVAAIVRPEFKDICTSVPNDYIDKLVQEYEERESYFKPVGFGYQDENTQPWLNERKPSIDWFYWDRYRKYLRERKGLSLFGVGGSVRW